MSQRTSKEMYPLIERWRSSEESKKDFCVQQQINLHTFTYWVNKYDKSKLVTSDHPTELSNFVALQVNGESGAVPPCSIELTYPNGIKLRFTNVPSLSYLMPLLQTTV